MEGKDNPTFFFLVSLLKRDFSFIPFFFRIFFVLANLNFPRKITFTHAKKIRIFSLFFSYANTHALLISISHSPFLPSMCLFPFGKMDFEFDKKNIDILLCCYFIFFYIFISLFFSRWCTKVLKKHETAINKQHQFSSELHFSPMKFYCVFYSFFSSIWNVYLFHFLFFAKNSTTPKTSLFIFVEIEKKNLEKKEKWWIR